MLRVQLLKAGAIAPTVAHPGEDLGFDLYAAEDVVLTPGRRNIVGTGIAAHFTDAAPGYDVYGLLIRDRSSMASKGITVSAGVIDAGYRGEIKVILTLEAGSDHTYTVAPCHDMGDVCSNLKSEIHPGFQIRKGDKIAQMIPVKVMTKFGVLVVESLEGSLRGSAGFGSSDVPVLHTPFAQ